MKTGGRIALGLLLALVAQFLAVMLAGAGHGWVAPFLLSFALWVLLPMTLAIAWPIGRGSSRVALLAIVVVALCADAVLVSRTISEVDYLSAYIKVNGLLGLLIIGLWLCLWSFWQAMLVGALVVGREPLGDANG